MHRQAQTTWDNGTSHKIEQNCAALGQSNFSFYHIHYISDVDSPQEAVWPDLPPHFRTHGQEYPRPGSLPAHCRLRCHVLRRALVRYRKWPRGRLVEKLKHCWILHDIIFQALRRRLQFILRWSSTCLWWWQCSTKLMLEKSTAKETYFLDSFPIPSTTSSGLAHSYHRWEDDCHQVLPKLIISTIPDFHHRVRWCLVLHHQAQHWAVDMVGCSAFCTCEHYEPPGAPCLAWEPSFGNK